MRYAQTPQLRSSDVAPTPTSPTWDFEPGPMRIFANLMSLFRKTISERLSLGRVVLRGGGKVAMSDAQDFAKRQYAKFKEDQKALRHEQADRAIAEIKSARKTIGNA